VRAGKWSVVATFGALLALLPAGAALSGKTDTPVLSPIHGSFVVGEKATHYTATLTPAVNPTYVWSFVKSIDEPNCIKTEIVNGGRELIFHHADTDGCTHPTPVHNVTIGLTVTDNGYACTATIFGSEGPGTPPVPEWDGPPASCVSQVAPPPPPPPTPTVTIPKITKPPPPPTPCRCTKLNLKIEPSSIGFFGVFVPGRMHLQFDLKWTLRCTAGKIGCKAKFVLSPPEPVAKLKTKFIPRNGTIECKGPCGKDLTGTETFDLYGGPQLDHKHRAGETIDIKVKRFCQGRELTTPEFFKLVFDRRGFVDKKKSQLVAHI
jgi:hypothetical protein